LIKIGGGGGCIELYTDGDHPRLCQRRKFSFGGTRSDGGGWITVPTDFVVVDVIGPAPKSSRDDEDVDGDGMIGEESESLCQKVLAVRLLQWPTSAIVDINLSSTATMPFSTSLAPRYILPGGYNNAPANVPPIHAIGLNYQWEQKVMRR